MPLYVEIIDDSFSTTVRVSSVKPEGTNEDEVDTNSFVLWVPKNSSAEAIRNVALNVLRNGGAEVVHVA